MPNVAADQVRAFVTQEQASERPVAAPTPPKQAKQDTKSHTLESSNKSRPKRKGSRLQPVGLIPVTVRLRPEIAGALKRASLERQLEGEEIFSQQDLVESALEPWLRDEGFLS